MSKQLPKKKIDPKLLPYIPKVKKHYYFPTIHEDICDDILEKQNVMLTGHTGTGKSSLFEQTAADQQQPILRVPFNGTMTVPDLTGFWGIKDGETVWHDGVLPFCMKNNVWLVAEEIDFADPPVLAVCNQVLENNGVLVIKERGNEIVEAGEDFRFFATANTVGCMAEFRDLYQGTNILNEAFLDRWNIYNIQYMPPEEEVKVLLADVEGMTEDSAEAMVEVANDIREAFKNELVECTFGYRKLERMSRMTVRKKERFDDHPEEYGHEVVNALYEAINHSLFGHVIPSDAAYIANLAQMKFGGKTSNKKGELPF